MLLALVSRHTQVHIVMPKPLRIVKNMVERLKTVSQHVTLKANMGGQMQFSCTGDMAKTTVYFKDLAHPAIGVCCAPNTCSEV